MNPSLDLSLHWWRGIGPDREPDLFLIRWRLGFLTLSVCRVCVLDRYRKLRSAIEEAVSKEVTASRGHGWTSDNAGLHPHDREGR